MAERPDLRPERQGTFWRFVAERQRVWYRRVVMGEEPPWTADDALRNHRFTNVYRVLDPGTQYAIQSILAREESRRDRLFNVLLYRLVGRAETHASVGFQRLDEFEAGDLEAALRERDEVGPVFTGAYTVSGYGWVGGDDKIENVARLFADVRERFDEFAANVGAATGPEAVYSAVRDLPGFGNFLAYQVLVDLLYPLPDHDVESFLPFSPDEWAAAGPGAKRGIDLLARETTDRSPLEVMRWLWRDQEAAFDRHDADFVWLRDDRAGRVELSLADVQNCCCEFSKYHRVRTGTGRTRRRFRTGERRSAEELRAVYSGYPISVEESSYVDVATGGGGRPP